MPLRPNLELPRILTPRIAAAVGITRSEVRGAVRRGHWQSLAVGAVLTRPDPPSRADWAEVGLALAGPTAALSGWDAARFRGVGDRRTPPAPVLVLTREDRSHRVGGVYIRRTERHYSTELTSSFDPTLPLAPVVALPRAVADHALTLRELSSARALVAQAVQRGCPLGALVTELDAGPQQGSAHLRRAIAEIGEGARSAAEVSAVARLRRARVPAFELNVPVHDAAGRVVFVLDIFWRKLRAALEIDSREHHYALADWERTLRRHNKLTRHGLAMSHRPPSEVMVAGRGWITETEAWLHERAAELRVSCHFDGGVLTDAGPYVIRGLGLDFP